MGRIGVGVLTVLLAAGLLSPPAVAEPTGRDEDPALGDQAFHGVARGGTVDSAEEWFPDQVLSCSTVVTTFAITLILDEGAPTNLLELSAPTALGLTVEDHATTAKPATLVVQQPDACVDFTVSSISVSGDQPYTVLVSTLAS